MITAHEILVAEEGFWDDQLRARGIMQELEHVREEVMHYKALLQRANDLCELCTIATTDDEWAQIETQMMELQKEVDVLAFHTFFSGEYDHCPAIVTIHAGAGGVDAQDWAEMVMRMYMRWAEKRSFTVRVLDRIDGGEAGIKSMTMEIDGRWAYGYLRAESGVHRLVRLSPFNADNLRQTSFARVEVMPVISEVKEVHVSPEDLRIDTYRASGAGGQHVNTTDSAVRITHIPTGIQAQCQNERSQAQNKESAMKLLMAKLHKMHLEEQEKKQKELRGEMVDAGWGNQIRSYVVHPYKMVKDHRTKHETAQVDAVLEGDVEDFMMAYLQQ